MKCRSCKGEQVCNPLTQRCRKCGSLEKVTVQELAKIIGVNTKGTKKAICDRILPKRALLPLPRQMGLLPILESSLDTRDKLLSDLDIVTQALTLQEQEKQKLSEALGQVEQELQEAQSQLSQAQNETEKTQLRQDIVQITQEKRDLETKVQNIVKENEDLNQGVKSLKGELGSQQAQLTQAQQSLIAFGEERDALIMELKQREKEKQEAVQELQAKSQELGEKGEEYVQLLEDKSALEQQQLSLTKDLNLSKEEQGRLEDEYKRVQEDLKQLQEAQVGQDPAALAQAKQQLERQLTEQKAITRELQDLRTEEAKIRRELEEATRATQIASKEVKEQEETFTKAKQELIQDAKNAQSQVLDLQKELAVRDAQLDVLGKADISCSKLKDLQITENLRHLLEKLCLSVPVPRAPVQPSLSTRGGTGPQRTQGQAKVKQPVSSMRANIQKAKKARLAAEAKQRAVKEKEAKIAFADEVKRKERAQELKAAKEQKGRIGVNVRIRPLFEKGRNKETKALLGYEQGGQSLTVPYRDGRPSKTYYVSGEIFSDDAARNQQKVATKVRDAFDAEVKTKSPNEEFYQIAAQDDVEAYIRDKQTAAIYAYGPSGTGKTFTMNYITERAIRALLESKEGKKNGVHVAFLDIYKNNISDLLAQDQKNLKIPQSFPQLALTFAPITRVDEYFRLYNNLPRVVGMTAANDQSSRSHLMTLLTTAENPSETTNLLALIDLAGSEDLTDLTPAQLPGLGYIGLSLGKRNEVLKTLKDESKAINTSLAGLTALFEKVGREIKQGKTTRGGTGPWRQDSLVQISRLLVKPNTRVSLIVALSPAEKDLPKTHHSMEFASKASDIELGGVSYMLRYFLQFI